MALHAFSFFPSLIQPEIIVSSVYNLPSSIYMSWVRTQEIYKMNQLRSKYYLVDLDDMNLLKIQGSFSYV